MDGPRRLGKTWRLLGKAGKAGFEMVKTSPIKGNSSPSAGELPAGSLAEFIEHLLLGAGKLQKELCVKEQR